MTYSDRAITVPVARPRELATARIESVYAARIARPPETWKVVAVVLCAVGAGAALVLWLASVAV
jgi:hypothetical protein